MIKKLAYVIVFVITAAGCGMAAVGIGAWLMGCGGSQPQPDIAKAAAICISERTAKQLECVSLYSTRPEIDACRATVQRTLDCTDGGLEVTVSLEGGK